MYNLNCFYLPNMGFSMPNQWYPQYLPIPQEMSYVQPAYLMPSTFEHPQQNKNAPTAEITATEPSLSNSENSSLVKLEDLERMVSRQVEPRGRVFQKPVQYSQAYVQSDHTQESPIVRRRRRAPKKVQKNAAALKYKKKNTESNISNQIFSFVCSKSKSRPLLIRILKSVGAMSARSIGTFYECVAAIKRNRAKYMNKKVIGELVDIQNSYFREIFDRNRINMDSLSLDTFSKVLRILVHVYITQMNHLAVITSKKIDRQTTREHLQRRRQVLHYVQNRLAVRPRAQ